MKNQQTEYTIDEITLKILDKVTDIEKQISKQEGTQSVVNKLIAGIALTALVKNFI